MPVDKTYPFNPKTDIPSLDGKVILITGANTGLGKRTAWELAQHSPTHIYMAARSEEKVRAAVKEVQAVASKDTKVSFLSLDLSSFDKVKKAAKEFLNIEKRLDVLLLNAGIMGHPAGLTENGYEIHMGTNHMGHALLFKLLEPLISQTAAAHSGVRVITLGSAGVNYVPKGIQFDTLKSAESDLPLPSRYSETKLAAVFFAQQAAKKYSNFKTIAINPGEVDTELFTREAGDERMRQLQQDVAPNVVIPISEGVKNHLWATSSPDIVSGTYYEPVGGVVELHAVTGDEAMSQKLWEWTAAELEGQHL